MHAWLCENPTGVDALTWKELSTPSPKAGEVLLEIKAASLNFPEELMKKRVYKKYILRLGEERLNALFLLVNVFALK